MLCKIARALLPVLIIGGALAGCVTIDTRTPIEETTQAPKSTATEEFVVFSPTTEVTKTPEPTPTPEATKSPYEIDAEKVYVMPPSYEDVVANPEKYQQGPDPLADIEFFKNWWLNEMIPVLGYQNDKEMNVYTHSFVNTGDMYAWTANPDHSKPLMGIPQFFYFEHSGTIFPVLILTVQYVGFGLDIDHNVGTYAVILHAKDFTQPDSSTGFDAIRYISEGYKIRYVMCEKKAGPGITDEETRKLYDDGYNWVDFDGGNWIGRDPAIHWDDYDNKFAIGVGEIYVWN